MNFPTAYRVHERFTSEPGQREVTTYNPRVDSDGVLHLEESGKINIYDQIQSHKDSCDINLLIQRCVATGDDSILSRVQGAYGDFSDMPRTYADMLNRLREAREFFDGLPLPTRQKFDCNFEQFISAMDKPGFLDNFGEPKPATAETAPVVEGGTQE